MPQLEFAFAKRFEGMTGNVIREILKLTQKPDVISFAGGLPSSDSFPVAELQEIAFNLLGRGGEGILQYGTTEGDAGLRDFLSGWLKERGIETIPDEVLILSGSQQGIDLIAKAVLDPGDVVVVERPTYLAALQIFKSYEVRFAVVPTDADGMDVDALDEIIRRERPKLIYTVPTFQNPSGITLSLRRRERLVEIADRHNLIVVEDDPYGNLRYSGDPVPCVKAFDRPGRVVYLGSFSKIVAPGLRVGYAVAEPTTIRRMIVGKQGTDVHTSNLSQRMVAEFCRSGRLQPHIERIRKEYGAKRNRMLDAMQSHFPQQAEWTKPDGGLFVWVTLQDGVSTTQLLEKAVNEEKVAFIPGSPFFVDGGGENTMRLNFSNAKEEEIDTGIARLGRVLQQAE